MAERSTGWVVVGIDGTAGSAGALRYAVQQARHRDCGLRLVHVGPRHEASLRESPALPWNETPYLPWDMWPVPYSAKQVVEAGKDLLQAAQAEVKALAPELAVITDLRGGSRISELVGATEGGQLLVIGRETRKGIDRLLFGATTASVAARAPVPTTVVPDDWEPGSTAGRVVVGLRNADRSEELLEAAFAEAGARGMGLEVLHAWELPGAYTTLIDTPSRDIECVKEATELFERHMSSWRDRHPDIPVTVHVVHDRPSHAIVSAAADAALVMLMRRSTPRHLGAHLGSTARAVVRAAPCPVQIVPQLSRQTEFADREVEGAGELRR